jgi:threonine/homoserine/homoserine lactone efflux protein
MTKKDYDRMTVGALVVTIAVGGLILYAQPENWLVTVPGYTGFTLLIWFSFKWSAVWVGDSFDKPADPKEPHSKKPDIKTPNA